MAFGGVLGANQLGLFELGFVPGAAPVLGQPERIPNEPNRTTLCAEPTRPTNLEEPNRTTKCAPVLPPGPVGVSMPAPLQKRPDEAQTYVYNFGTFDAIIEGDTVASAVIKQYYAPGSTPYQYPTLSTDLAISAITAVDGGTEVEWFMSGGLNNQTYLLAILATTAAGATLEGLVNVGVGLT